jgi:hypothetical protein
VFESLEWLQSQTSPPLVVLGKQPLNQSFAEDFKESFGRIGTNPETRMYKRKRLPYLAKFSGKGILPVQYVDLLLKGKKCWTGAASATARNDGVGGS